MKSAPSNQPLVENEVVFRQANETVQKGFAQLNKIAEEDGQEPIAHDETMPLHFYCECSDENCQQRIAIRTKTYTAIHEKRDQFIILPEHNTQSLERVVRKTPSYWVVEKFAVPSEVTTGLRSTDVNYT
jgi:hypothetical protein